MKYSTALNINKKTYPIFLKRGLLKVTNEENISNENELTVFYGDHKSYLDPIVAILTLQHFTDNDDKIIAPIYPAYMGYEPNPPKQFPRTIVEFGYKHRNFLAKLGALPLFNKDYDLKLRKESFEELCMLFKRHKRILIFPEGRIQREKVHQPYKLGIAKLDKAMEPDITYFNPFDITYSIKGIEIEFGEKFDVVFDIEIPDKLDTIEDKIFELQSGGI